MYSIREEKQYANLFSDELGPCQLAGILRVSLSQPIRAPRARTTGRNTIGLRQRLAI